MTDLGRMRFFLGIEVLQQTNEIYICQRKYTLEVLKWFGMEESNAVMNPMVPDFKADKIGEGNKIDETYYKKKQEVLCISLFQGHISCSR